MRGTCSSGNVYYSGGPMYVRLITRCEATRLRKQRFLPISAAPVCASAEPEPNLNPTLNCS